jgi:hypothetical protein
MRELVIVSEYLCERVSGWLHERVFGRNGESVGQWKAVSV